jgi:hypothetical protein
MADTNRLAKLDRMKKALAAKVTAVKTLEGIAHGQDVTVLAIVTRF